MNHKITLIISFILLGIFSCTEPYDYNLELFEPSLIVQGMVANNGEPVRVELSRTVELQGIAKSFEQYAIVTISDQFGNTHVLNETTPGVYITNELACNVGDIYILSITTMDGIIFESDPVELIQGPGIDSLFYSYNEKYNYESNRFEKGIDIKVNTKEFPGNDDYYLKWEYVETWEIVQKWLAQDFDPVNFPNPIPYVDKISGWKIDNSTDIIIDNSMSVISNSISNKNIVFLSERNPKPYFGYSILVNQYTINKAVYNFWKMVKETNSDNGSVFDNVPYNAVSNIHCCNSTKVKVFGYFDASYVSSKRIFLKSPVLGVEFVDYNVDCRAQEVSMGLFLGTIFGSKNAFVLGYDDRSVIYTKQRYCIDVRSITTTMNKPNFWIY